ncbi:MAG: hypothetical protein JO102_00060, partial [Elusimicrobia bacterium]|nr:hypothetical protein [Elusimicrobiota bacterium]
MAVMMEKRASTTYTTPVNETAPDRHAYQAYQILHFGFTVAPILAGLDKFTN